MLLAGLSAQAWSQPGTAAQPTPQTATELATVASVDLSRYQGTWYQLALYPNKFQARCASDTRATYTLQDDGTVRVANQCRGADGQAVEAIGQAKPAGSSTVVQGQLVPPQLKVRFAPQWLAWLPMVWGDYWVIQLASDYRYVVVGEPKREFLWVLARNTSLTPADWSAIQARLKDQGYDPNLLIREKHSP